MANPAAIDPALHPSAERSASGSGSGVDIGTSRTAAELVLDVLAVDGDDASLVVTVETSPNNAAPWREVDSFDAVEAVGQHALSVLKLDRYVRVSWALAGDTPVFTFSVNGVAHQVYFGVEDLRAEVPAAVFEDQVSDHFIADAVIKASADIEDACNGAYTLPLVAWPASVRERGAKIAIFRIISKRGFQPDGSDQILKDNSDDAMRWLRRVSQGQLRPIGIVDSTETEYEGGAVIVSDPPRRW
jgi:phage gp36-like protein